MLRSWFFCIFGHHTSKCYRLHIAFNIRHCAAVLYSKLRTQRIQVTDVVYTGLDMFPLNTGHSRYTQGELCLQRTQMTSVTHRVSYVCSEYRWLVINRAMMEAARTSETSVDIQLRTRQYIPEGSELHNSQCWSRLTGLVHRSWDKKKLNLVVMVTLVEKKCK
jgi:hypothetical protein